MRAAQGIWMIVGALVVSGCASQRSAQDVNRLKSDISLLDQRVAQLERSGIQGSTASWPNTDTTAPASTSALPEAAATAASPSASLKPSKRAIQQALKNAGFYQGTVDGKIGPKTREAVKAFQEVNGLKADGVVGRQTWEKLAPYLSMASSGGVASDSEIK